MLLSLLNCLLFPVYISISLSYNLEKICVLIIKEARKTKGHSLKEASLSSQVSKKFGRDFQNDRT